MCTIVTGLFDISRHKIDGRTWDEYLSWFSKTLKINAPMVVFVEKKTVDFVKKHRDSKETTIIETSIDNLYYYQYKKEMDLILISEDYLKKIKDANRIECRNSLYSIIQYSKFEFMKFASDKNYFNSSYFLWMDAGLSRFFDNLNFEKPYPSDKSKKVLLDNKNKILIQTFMSYYPDLFYADNLSEEYLLDNRSYVMGGMFGGSNFSIVDISKKIDDLFKEMLSKTIVNNEQIALGFLYKKYPKLFTTFINDARIHRSYELINALSK
jgi:hypothetical protein